MKLGMRFVSDRPKINQFLLFHRNFKSKITLKAIENQNRKDFIII